jgi:hypothetical protein
MTCCSGSSSRAVFGDISENIPEKGKMKIHEPLVELNHWQKRFFWNHQSQSELGEMKIPELNFFKWQQYDPFYLDDAWKFILMMQT